MCRSSPLPCLSVDLKPPAAFCTFRAAVHNKREWAKGCIRVKQQQSVEIQQKNPPVLNTVDFEKTPKSETTGDMDYLELLAELRIG